MNNLIAILAGGISEAKRYLKTEISFNRVKANLFAGLGSLFFISTAVIGYLKYIKYKQEKQLRESIEKSKDEITKMPTIRADEMGTHCLICLVKPSNIVLIPCNHLCVCSSCFEKIKKPENGSKTECPTCKQQVELKHQILIIYDGKPVPDLEMRKKTSSIKV